MVKLDHNPRGDARKESWMAGALCVVGGASPDAPSPFLDLARQAGLAVGRLDIPLVYGGPPGGVAGRFIDGAVEAGARDILAIVPRIFSGEKRPGEVRELFVETLPERRELLFKSASDMLALPGGIGTFDEVFGFLEWRYHGIIDAGSKLYLLEHGGFWSSFVAMLTAAQHQGFITPRHLECIRMFEDHEALASELSVRLRHVPECS
jgi:uncharacterized protein (TIGR00730 family)